MKVISVLIALVAYACAVGTEGTDNASGQTQATASDHSSETSTSLPAENSANGQTGPKAEEDATTVNDPAGSDATPKAQDSEPLKQEDEDKLVIVKDGEGGRGIEAFGEYDSDLKHLEDIEYIPELLESEDEEENITQSKGNGLRGGATKNYGKYSEWEALAKQINDIVDMRQKKAEELVAKITSEEEKKAVEQKVKEMKNKADVIKKETARIIDAGKRDTSLAYTEEDKSSAAFDVSSALFNSLKEYQDEQVETEADFVKSSVKGNRGLDVLSIISTRINILSDDFKTVSIAMALVPIVMISTNLF